MTELVDLAKALVAAGPVTALVVLVIAIFVTGVRGDWVFGWIYRKAEERSAKTETAIDKLLDILAPRRGSGG